MVYKDIRFDETVCGNIKVALEKEWLETNGLGGYSSSTIIGINTRRYHGLLIAPTEEISQRILFLSKLEEHIIIDHHSYYLSCNIYPNAIHPTGFIYLKEFRIDPFPTFVYKVNDVTIEKKVFMIYGKNTVAIMYRLIEGKKEVTLKVRPLVAFRSYHTLSRKDEIIQKTFNVRNAVIEYQPYEECPSLFFHHNGFLLQGTSLWYYNFTYPKESERGFAMEEDLFNPFEISYCLHEEKPIFFVADLGNEAPLDGERLEKNELERRSNFIQNYTYLKDYSYNPSASTIAYRYLIQSNNAFIIKQKDGLNRILGGYPWFGEWGRDSMISLTGLTLVTGQFHIARSILKRYVRYIQDGRLPNYFSEDSSIPVYNSIDTALWFFLAVYKYITYTNDFYFVVDELYEGLRDIARFFIKGDDKTFRMDADGLIYCNKEHAQETWMDAQVGDSIITPRFGKIVEINALWFNAVKVLELISQQCNEKENYRMYNTLADKIKDHFAPLFWNDAKQCLYDYIDGDYANDSIRPNQIWAVSIPFALCTDTIERNILECVERELLTMYGLRSLSVCDKNYVEQYGGDWQGRDSAYHQGTVWSWLIGSFIDAYMKVNGYTDKSREVCEVLLKALFHHVLNDAGLGFISEIFDGDFPHQARGCIAQAWSVAEVIRVYHEYVLTKKPQLVPFYS